MRTTFTRARCPAASRAKPYDRAVAHGQVGRRLALFALAFAVAHHTGAAFAPLGDVGPTRWADWIELAVPWLVLGTAAGVLVAAGAGRREWIVFALGALLYAEGHGIHLAANSVGNFDRARRRTSGTRS